MIKRILLIFGLIFLFLCNLSAQKITVTIPENANSKYNLVFNKGLKQDTIRSGVFNFAGNATITIPEQYKDYAGVAILQVQGGKSHSFIVNHENFSMDYVDGNYTFKHSPENDYLYGRLKNTMIEQNESLYADRFIGLVQYMNALNAIVSGQERGLDARFRIHRYALEELDIEALYTSGLWFYIIDGLTKLGNQESFGNDMVKILGRVKSQEVFEALSNDLLMIVNQYAWDDAFDIIIPYIVETGRIEYPQGNMYAAFTLAKIRKGMTVPDLEGLKTPLRPGGYNQTILFFYESDCPNCRLEVTKLIANYPYLKKNNIRLISISADHDKKEYEAMSSTFLWPDKLCDFQSFGGSNFLNYGILGTPTYFLLDKDCRLEGRYATYEGMKF